MLLNIKTFLCVWTHQGSCACSNRSVCLLELNYESSLYILEMSLLSARYAVCKYFLLSYLNRVFHRAKDLIFYEVQFTDFAFYFSSSPVCQ